MAALLQVSRSTTFQGASPNCGRTASSGAVQPASLRMARSRASARATVTSAARRSTVPGATASAAARSRPPQDRRSRSSRCTASAMPARTPSTDPARPWRAPPAPHRSGRRRPGSRCAAGAWPVTPGARRATSRCRPRPPARCRRSVPGTDPPPTDRATRMPRTRVAPGPARPGTATTVPTMPAMTATTGIGRISRRGVATHHDPRQHDGDRHERPEELRPLQGRPEGVDDRHRPSLDRRIGQPTDLRETRSRDLDRAVRAVAPLLP